jgi:hypothetical protein
MRQASNLSRVLVLVVMAIVGIAGGRCLADEFVPAQAGLLTGELAQYFLDKGGLVLVAGDNEGNVGAFVIGRDIKEASDRLTRLRIGEVVGGCVREGVTCCDETNHVWVIDVEYGKDRFWLSLDAYCKVLPVEDGWDAGPGVPFEPLDADIWQRLKTEYGMTYHLMTLATTDHKTQVLVDPSWDYAGLSLPKDFGLRSLSPIILVNHVNPTTVPKGPATPPNGCADRRPCRTDSVTGWACYADNPHATGVANHSERHHWYVKNNFTGHWCEKVDKCSC